MAHLAKLGAVLAIVLRNVLDNSLVLPDSDSDEVLMLLQHDQEAAFMQSLLEELTCMGALTRT